MGMSFYSLSSVFSAWLDHEIRLIFYTQYISLFLKLKDKKMFRIFYQAHVLCRMFNQFQEDSFKDRKR